MEPKGIKRVLICCQKETGDDHSDKAIMFARCFLPDLYDLPETLWQTYNFAQDLPDEMYLTDLFIAMNGDPLPNELLDMMSEGMVVLIGDEYQTLTVYRWGKKPETVGIRPGMKRTFQSFKLKPILD